MSVGVGCVRGGPLVVLRLEGAAALAAATMGFAYLEQSWWLFAALILAPDLSMLAYLRNPRFGAVCYNIAHTNLAAAAVAAAGFWLDSTVVLACATIWLAHIGFDRMLGYGLKYRTAFGDTHLGRIGRGAPAP